MKLVEKNNYNIKRPKWIHYLILLNWFNLDLFCVKTNIIINIRADLGDKHTWIFWTTLVSEFAIPCVPLFDSTTANTTPLVESFFILLSVNGFDNCGKNGLVGVVWGSPVNGFAENGLRGLVGEVALNEGKDTMLDILSVGLLSGEITLCSNLPYSPKEKWVTVTGVAHLLRSSLDRDVSDIDCSSIGSLVSSGAVMPPLRDNVSLSPPFLNTKQKAKNKSKTTIKKQHKTIHSKKKKSL